MKMRKRRTSTTTAMTTTSVIFLINMDDIGRMQDVHEIDNIDDGTANNDGHLERKGFGESFLATNLVQTPEAVFQTHWVVRSTTFWITNPSPRHRNAWNLWRSKSSPISSNDKEAWFLNNKFFPAPWRTEAIPKCEATQGLSWRVDLGESPTPVRQWVQNSSNWRHFLSKDDLSAHVSYRELSSLIW